MRPLSDQRHRRGGKVKSLTMSQFRERIESAAGRRKLERQARVLDGIRGGLIGAPFGWPEHKRKAWIPAAAHMGWTLLSRTALTKRGYVLKRGAKPVGVAYWGAPLSRWVELYLVELQTTKLPNIGGETRA